jgi:hypothetical protein
LGHSPGTVENLAGVQVLAYRVTESLNGHIIDRSSHCCVEPSQCGEGALLPGFAEPLLGYEGWILASLSGGN